MLQNAALLVGGVCLCKNALGLDIPQSTCCYTPDIEPESLTIGEHSFIIDLTKAPSISKKGNAVYVDNKEKEIRTILVRVKKNRFQAFSRHCTHGNQALSYIPERKLLQCNSYNHSLFDLDGSVWKGPAPDPIKVYPVKYDKNRLEIFYM
jgi:Rieske Fe-S protein